MQDSLCFPIVRKVNQHTATPIAKKILLRQEMIFVSRFLNHSFCFFPYHKFFRERFCGGQNRVTIIRCSSGITTSFPEEKNCPPLKIPSYAIACIRSTFLLNMVSFIITFRLLWFGGSWNNWFLLLFLLGSCRESCKSCRIWSLHKLMFQMRKLFLICPYNKCQRHLHLMPVPKGDGTRTRKLRPPLHEKTHNTTASNFI